MGDALKAENEQLKSKVEAWRRSLRRRRRSLTRWCPASERGDGERPCALLVVLSAGQRAPCPAGGHSTASTAHVPNVLVSPGRAPRCARPHFCSRECVTFT